MSINNSTLRAVESMLISSGDQRLINFTAGGDALPGGGNYVAGTDLPLMSNVNAGFVNLNDGQLGIFCSSPLAPRQMNVALRPADTFNEAPDIFIAQGTSTSQTPGLGTYPVWNNRPYESSGHIIGRHHKIVTGRLAQYERFSTWVLGEAVPFNTTDNNEYTISVSYGGQIFDTENTMHAFEKSTFDYVSPDYTSLGLTSDLDHLVKNFVYRINRNSKQFYTTSQWGANEPVVAFAVGTGAGTNINDAAFDNGGTVPVFIRNGVTFSISLNRAQVLNLRTAITAPDNIILVDLSTAGAAADAQHMVLLGLDRELTYDDREPNKKISVNVGYLRGFNFNVSKVEAVSAFEGEGYARYWDIKYTNTAGQRKYSQYQRKEWPFIEVPSGIVPNELYNVYIIEHRSVQEITFTDTSVSPKKTIILVPTCDTTTRDDLQTMLNQWVKSTPHYSLVNNGQGGDLNVGDFDSVYCP